MADVAAMLVSHYVSPSPSHGREGGVDTVSGGFLNFVPFKEVDHKFCHLIGIEHRTASVVRTSGEPQPR